jgi:hypothetical protein
VLLRPIEEIDGQYVEAPRDPDGAVTIARGEVTGHRHCFLPGPGSGGSALPTAYVLLENPGEVTRVWVGESQELVHEEHAPLRLAPGAYCVSLPYEYDGPELQPRMPIRD